MKIKDVMSIDFKWVAPETTLHEAAQIMKERDIGFLLIGENDRLVGTVTDRDIVIRALAANADPRKDTVKQAMTKKVMYCYEDQSVDEICENMSDIKVRRLPVLNRAKRLVGVVSLGDLSQAKQRESGEALQTITKAAAKNKKAA